MMDRFGKLPDIVQRLTDIVRLRLLAVDLGMERIVFKSKTFICFFVSQQDSPFYTSRHFCRYCRLYKNHPRNCQMKDNTEKLSLSISPVISVADALKLIREMNSKKA